MSVHNRLHPRTYQSDSFVKRRKNKTILLWSAAVLGLASWIFVLSRLSFLPGMDLYIVTVYSSDREIEPVMQAATYNVLHGSYLGLFSRSNLLIYPKQAIIAAVASASPRIGDVEVKRDGWHTLTVSVSEKTPGATVCADLPSFDDDGSLSPDDNCYLVNDSGLIFKAASASSTSGYDRYYIPSLPDDGSALGMMAASSTQFADLQKLFQGVRSAGIMPEGLLVKDGGEYELYVDNPKFAKHNASSTPGTVVVYLNDTAGLASELDNLTLFWNNMVDAAKSKSTSVAWSDIKLQYPPNVYYTEAK